jgi:pimeloyl-ACP methyl ester carboxylesterase
MTKTQTPSSIEIDGVGVFTTNAVPDPFDERDLIYRPRLAPLKVRFDQRDDKKKHLFVLHQAGNSCTGHAVASLIQTVTRSLVSPYMLYYFARRYDQFEGEEDIGSSLRGAFKGWFYHGVARQEDWHELDPPSDLDLESPEFIRTCRERPLGAFYRVNPYRLDDMQSAINELGAIAVSAAIHNGWINPMVMQRGNRKIHLIARPVNPQALGGHAFALVGYNEVGFLVQNSWGTGWGKGGYATLPYEDWLENAYDAWVARPGVPQTPFYSGHTQNSTGTGGALVTGPGPDLKRLAVHVINLGNNGKLSQGGRFRSTPRQMEAIFQNMERWHTFWEKRSTPSPQRHIVLYAHGGIVTESNGLLSAEEHLNWWLNSQVYPIYFVWETGPRETLFGHIYDLAKNKLPFGVIGFDLMEQVDRWIEKRIAPLARWLWDEIKQNARAASARIQAPENINWRLDNSGRLSPEAEQVMQTMPGASLLVTRLEQYIAQHGKENIKIHLVGHSAGTVLHASLLERLADAGMQVDSLAFLAAALRVDEFWEKVMPHLGPQGNVNRFANFVLSDSRELEDAVLPQPGPALYHKSILYLLSRGAELPSHRVGSLDERPYEVPMLGMERFMNQRLTDLLGMDNRASMLREEIERLGGQVISSPSSASESDSRSEATMHTDFDSNQATMASVMMRILNVKEQAPQYNYPAYASLYSIGADGSPLISESQAVGTVTLLQAVETEMPGTTPLVEMAEPQTQAPKAPPPAEPGPIPEVAVAPRSEFPVVDILQGEGWRMARRRRSK